MVLMGVGERVGEGAREVLVLLWVLVRMEVSVVAVERWRWCSFFVGSGCGG